MRKNLTLLMRGPKIYDVVEAGMGGKEKKIRRLWQKIVSRGAY
jgi:hypothetical protein